MNREQKMETTMTTDPDPHPGEDSLIRDMRARDKALGPGVGNLNVDTADRRILLRMYDQACGELFEALDEVTRLEKERAARDRIAPCGLCTTPVLVHDDGSTTGGVDTLAGIRCDRCLNAPENE